MSPGPYSIGSSHWPGLSKVIEECGELMQVAGKLLGTGGKAEHWDGSDLRVRLVEEVGDLRAALDYFTRHNMTEAEGLALEARTAAKVQLFEKWHREQGDTQSITPQPGHIVTSGEQAWVIERHAARGQVKLSPLNASGNSLFVMPGELEADGKACDEGPQMWVFKDEGGPQ